MTNASVKLFVKKETRQVIQAIEIHQIERSPYQPRQTFSHDYIEALQASIQTHGLIELIVVRPLSVGRYQLIVGECRWRAVQAIPQPTIRAIVRDCSDEVASTLALVENIQRQDVNAIALAKAYDHHIIQFALSIQTLAAQLGISRQKLGNTLALLQLHPLIQQWIGEDKLQASSVKTLTNLAPDKQLVIAKNAFLKGWNARQIERAARQAKHRQKMQKEQKEQKEQTKRGGHTALLPKITHFIRRLSDYLGAKVKLDETHKQLVIDYYDNDILAGICQKIGLPNDE